MEWINQIITQIRGLIQWWAIIAPWEMGIRVRLGKRTKLLYPGIYMRIPLIDTIYYQSVRLRIIPLPPHTVTTMDKQTVTITLACGYSITDILKLFNSIQQPEATISSLCVGASAEYIAKTNLDDCSPLQVEEYVRSQLANYERYGINIEYIKITGYAVVKTYRLIQDTSWMPDNVSMDSKKQ